MVSTDQQGKNGARSTAGLFGMILFLFINKKKVGQLAWFFLRMLYRSKKIPQAESKFIQINIGDFHFSLFFEMTTFPHEN